MMPKSEPRREQKEAIVKTFKQNMLPEYDTRRY